MCVDIGIVGLKVKSRTQSTCILFFKPVTRDKPILANCVYPLPSLGENLLRILGKSIFSCCCQVEGFSMSGRVTKSPGGKVIGGAKVLLDKVRAAVTDENGLYYFENIQSGKHKIKITAGM